MKLNKLVFRNFASYGDRDQVIELPEDPAFFLVEGHNGAGKTTIPDVMRFLWYGKVDGKNKKDLANRLNGNAYVRGEGMVKGHEVVVERGIAPNKISLAVDGVPYDKANATVGPDDYLKDELLELPAYVFNNAICLSITDFKSFLKLSAQDKRKLIDRIFAFEVITKMREAMNKVSGQLKRDIERLGTQIDTSSRSYESSLAELSALATRLESTNTEDAKKAQSELEQFNKVYEMHSEKVRDFKVKVDEQREMQRDVADMRAKVQAKKNEVNRQLGLYDNDKCPTCQTDLSGAFHEKIKNALLEEIELRDGEIEALDKQWDEIEAQFKGLREQEAALGEKGAKIRSRISVITNDLQKLNDSGVNEQIKTVEKIVSDLKDNIDKDRAERAAKDERAAWFKVIEQALIDKGGIKQLAMQSIIPAFNSEIYRMMGEMHLDHQVVFDENFDAEIMHMGEPIPASTLSAGETVKVDFAVLISFIRLLKMKFPSINVMFLDEIFASVDQDGIYTICKILKGIVKDLGVNIFVVSHRPLPNEVFEYKIEVRKSRGFSNLEVKRLD